VKYKELTINKFIWSTSFSHLEATDGQTKIVLENYSSEERLTATIKELSGVIAKLQSVIPAVSEKPMEQTKLAGR
jgi:hypothetical protein